jgi:hypothetical protein
MKKIFIPALLFLFVSSVALAETKFSFSGSYEFGGRYIYNHGVVKDTESNAAYNFQYLDFDISASVDSFALYVHANPFDRRIGQLDTTASGGLTNIGDFTLNSEYIDRAFATYAFLPNLVFVGGRVQAGGVLSDGAAPFAGGYEYLSFGSGAYNTTFSERVNGDGLGVIFVANENLNFTLVNERYVESSIESLGAVNSSVVGFDADGYILKANASFGDVVIKPYLSYVTLPYKTPLGGLDDLAAAAGGAGASISLTESAHTLAAYVGGGYNPKSGLSVNAAFGILKYLDGKVGLFDSSSVLQGEFDLADIPLSFGGYLNVAFAQDIFKIGLECAYASYKWSDDIPVAGYYQFGGDFDRTYVIDGLLGGTSNGIPAMTTIQLYAEITPIEKLTLLPRVAYYFSNVNEDGKDANLGFNALGLNSSGSTGGLIGEKTTFIEVDVVASYAWTESTAIYGGVAYVQADKLTAGEVEADPAFGIVYGLATSF